MSISFDKTAPLPTPTPVNGLSPEQILREMIARRFSSKHGDDYCDADTLQQFLRAGSNAGIDSFSARNLIEMELERASIVNEQRLLEDLEEILFRLTGREKRLKTKDRQDAMQFVCKARSGFSRGLDPQVATRFVLDFCRTNLVAQKAGLFQWKVP